MALDHHAVAEILRTEIQPFVAQDGGHVELVDVKDNVVFVQMSGACRGCPSSTITLKMGIERILKAHFPDLQEVLSV